MDTITSGISCMVDQNPCGWLPSLGQAETAVTNLPAGRTHPFLVPERLKQSLSVSVLETRRTELPPDPSAVLVVADCFCVSGFLTALVTGGPIDTVIDLVRGSLHNFDMASWRACGNIVQFYRKFLSIRGDTSATIV